MDAGTIIRAYIVMCITCHSEETIKDDGRGYMTKAVAEYSLRNFDGWSKTKKGWKCRRCLKRN